MSEIWEYDQPKGKFILGDCLETMQNIPDSSVDMILCDLPYGTTYASWDSIIPIKYLWNQYIRISKNDTPIVLTALQPFSSLLVVSNLEMFRCEWIWNKNHASNIGNANRHPMKIHENILVFSKKQSKYNPQKTQGKPNHSGGQRNLNNPKFTQTMMINTHNYIDDFTGMKFPKSIQEFPKHPSNHNLHPTQKPVALFEYLIKTYTNKGDTVLDNCAGSGTTAIAAINTQRNWICIEKEKEYFDLAVNRINNHIDDLIGD